MLRRLRGVLGMSLVWAIGWAITGLGLGVASRVLPFLPWDAFFEVFDAPLPALGVPGAIGGAFFAVILRMAARRQRFDDLSLPRVATLGAVGGVLLSLVPELLVTLGLATLTKPGLFSWEFVVAKAIGLGALGAASAALTLRVAQGARSDVQDAVDDASRAIRQSGDVRHLAASRPVATERSRSATRSPGTP